jgi:hypothetical protein
MGDTVNDAGHHLQGSSALALVTLKPEELTGALTSNDAPFTLQSPRTAQLFQCLFHQTVSCPVSNLSPDLFVSYLHRNSTVSAAAALRYLHLRARLPSCTIYDYEDRSLSRIRYPTDRKGRRRVCI